MKKDTLMCIEGICAFMSLPLNDSETKTFLMDKPIGVAYNNVKYQKNENLKKTGQQFF